MPSPFANCTMSEHNILGFFELFYGVTASFPSDCREGAVFLPLISGGNRSPALNSCRDPILPKVDWWIEQGVSSCESILDS